jgi:hypothetical protein
MQCVLNFTIARWKQKGLLAADETRYFTSIITSELRKDFPTAEAETGICGSSPLVSEYDKHRGQFLYNFKYFTIIYCDFYMYKDLKPLSR